MQLSFKVFEHTGWDNSAHAYVRYWSSLTSQTIEPLLQAVHVKEGSHLLDIATGRGDVASRVAQRGARVIGVDFSAQMLKEARGMYPEIEFREGDAEHLPFADNSFDAAVINFGILHFEKPENALLEAKRVLKNDGRLGFTVWLSPEENPGFKIILDAITKYGARNVALPAGPPFFRFSDPEESRRTLLDIGFSSPQATKVSMIWRLKSADDFFNAFLKGAVRTGGLLRAQSHEALESIRGAVCDAAKEYERGGMLEIPTPALIVSAVKQ